MLIYLVMIQVGGLDMKNKIIYLFLLIYVIIVLIFIIELFMLYRYGKCVDNNFKLSYCKYYTNY